VQATLLTGNAVTRAQRLRTHLNFYAFVRD
jgi:hypothetical protein